MKNSASWEASKFVYRGGRLRASKDSRSVGVASRLSVDVIASLYDEQLPLHARGRLLDLGCGRVPLFASYRNLVSDCVCVDWANTPHRNEYLDLECDLSETLPLPDQEFDTIILSDVLEHIAEPQALWFEMARTLKVGGKLLLNVPFFYWLHEEPHDFYRYTEFALRRYAELTGLRLITLVATGGTLEILADLLAKSVVRIPLIGRPVAICLQSATGWLVRTSLGRRLSRATGKRFPFGYFLVAQRVTA